MDQKLRVWTFNKFSCGTCWFWCHISWRTVVVNGDTAGNIQRCSLLVVCMLSRFRRVWLSATLGSVARQAPLSLGISRQECWSGLPCPPSRDLPDPGIKPTSLMSPALAGRFFTISTTWEAQLFWRISFLRCFPCIQEIYMLLAFCWNFSFNCLLLQDGT